MWRPLGMTHTPGKARKFLHHPLINSSFEGDDQGGKIGERFPSPVHELGIVSAGRMLNVDFVLVSAEAQRVPFLRLAAIFAAPGLTYDLARNVVGEPFLDLTQFLDRLDVGFFVELAQRGRPRILAGVNAPLRHLPNMSLVDMLRAADAAIDTESIRVTMLQAAWRLDHGLDADLAIAVASWFAADAGRRVVFATQHLHGGIGADISYPIHRYFLWGKQIALQLGAPSAQLARLGRRLAADLGQSDQVSA